MSKMEVIFKLLLVINCYYFSFGIGITNFDFGHTNTAYGDHLNQEIFIHGEYINHVVNSFTSEEKSNIDASLLTTEGLISSFKSKIFYCTSQTDKLTVELSTSNVANIFKNNSQLLLEYNSTDLNKKE